MEKTGCIIYLSPHVVEGCLKLVNLITCWSNQHLTNMRTPDQAVAWSWIVSAVRKNYFD